MANSGEYDAIVIGAGAGGLFTAARLAKSGYRTLVVERLDKVGGRASTTEIDGFKVNDGAIVIEVGGITEQTCEEVGAKFEIREPSPPILYRIGGKDVDVTGGGWGMLLGKLTRQGAKLVKGIGAARNDSGLPEDELSTADWVRKYTKNEGVHGIFRNMCASVFAVSSEELPARVFLTYFTRKSAFKRFGFHPEGTIGLWNALAEAFAAHGGDLLLSTEVTRIEVDGDTITGVTVTHEGQTRTITAPVVVSDIGPYATLDLVGREAFPEEYVSMVEQRNRPCAMIAINFASQEPLISAPGMLSFAKSRRVAYLANFTETCPEMAPAGWHLYVGTSVPEPAIGDFDEAAETELLLDDLRDTIPGFDEKARILSTTVTRDGWPPQRAVAGFDLPHTTDLTGLWNVGDAVKEYANGGTTACAETAEIVVREIAQAFPRTQP
ncbi:phytoene desaturase family protein [Gordonia polyisoprenivorans]|uniref:phytoene desaturase family protein n=1 Tax=Gordonia polyisoprenivorans TaxID=84595 RepID=UPI001AD6BF10|nr:NAD(P)/FAD-dependent oxidoreductase [Gordonia polyisoprenivorans]QTI71932.1 NAD(P)/FAD-dependent oxidoreductase [Gordonia polyisoprenivorans]